MDRVVKLFPKGTRVNLADSSPYHDQAQDCNGKLLSGKIIGFEEDQYDIRKISNKSAYAYRIKWDNGHINAYRPEDIKEHYVPPSNKLAATQVLRKEQY